MGKYLRISSDGYPINLKNDIIKVYKDIYNEPCDDITDGEFLNITIQFTTRDEKYVKERYQNNKTYQDIANECGLTKEGVRKHVIAAIFKGVKYLRRMRK